MNDTERLLQQSCSGLFAEITEPVQRALDADEWPQQQWQKINELGLTDMLVQEHWSLAALVAELAGYHALNLPIVEAQLTRRYCPESTDPVTLQRQGTLAWGRYCQHALLVDDADCISLHSIDPQGLARSENLAGEPEDTAELGEALWRKTIAGAGQFLQLGHLLLHSARCAGALQRCVEMSVQYAGERNQFGKPIARFQAIQQQLAAAAGESARARVAVRYAASRAAQQGLESARIAVLAARVCCGEAVEPVVSAAHQVHGAMGFTLEYSLHRYTTRLMAWRSQPNNTEYWANLLGAEALRTGKGGLWPLLTAS